MHWVVSLYVAMRGNMCLCCDEQLAKATEQEEDSKKKVIALDKEIERVREQKVSCFDTSEICQLCWFILI